MAEAALNRCAEIQDEMGDTAGAHTTRLIEGGVMLRRKEATSPTAGPSYADATPHTTVLHDQWVGAELLSALRIAQLDNTDPALVDAAANAVRDYEIKKLKGMLGTND
jgi:hypothetical protein